MRGKAGLVIGLAAGYVLGTRAGRERYEQIKTQAQKLWNLAPVQKQVAKAKGLAASSAMALPGVVWDGAVKVVKAAAKSDPGARVDAAVAQGKRSATTIKKAAERAAADAAEKTEEILDEADGRGGA